MPLTSEEAIITLLGAIGLVLIGLSYLIKAISGLVTARKKESEVETLREQSDIDTRKLVNDAMKEYMQENEDLREQLHKLELGRIEDKTRYDTQVEGLTTQIDGLRRDLNAERSLRLELERHFEERVQTMALARLVKILNPKTVLGFPGSDVFSEADTPSEDLSPVTE